MRVRYNAPTVLTFALLCALILLLDRTGIPGLIKEWFEVPGKDRFSTESFRDWVTVISHIAGHYNWPHLINNFAVILLVGPMLEESYGSFSLLVMILITALVTGVLNILLFPSSLMGASGVVFMMILLASFTNFSRGEIPLTFILVLVLYLGTQLVDSIDTNNISHFAHIVGGFCGSLFGFIRPPRRQVVITR